MSRLMRDLSAGTYVVNPGTISRFDSPCISRLACESPLRRGAIGACENGACRLVGPDEHARLSGVADELLDRRVGVGRREEPPRYESGFRAHGSNQQFHRLLRHAVARALTTAPSLAGVSPSAADILIRPRWRRKGRPGRCRTNAQGVGSAGAVITGLLIASGG